MEQQILMFFEMTIDDFHRTYALLPPHERMAFVLSMREILSQNLEQISSKAKPVIG